jgi:hypothetical protein
VKKHCITIDQRGSFNAPAALCGAFASMANVTDVAEEIDCEDCLIRVLARVHNETGVLLKNLGMAVVRLRAAVEKASVRD